MVKLRLKENLIISHKFAISGRQTILPPFNEPPKNNSHSIAEMFIDNIDFKKENLKRTFKFFAVIKVVYN